MVGNENVVLKINFKLLETRPCCFCGGDWRQCCLVVSCRITINNL